MNSVADVLQASTIEADRVILPAVQLDRPLYEKVDKVLKGAGGKWNRSQKAHLFPRDPRQLLAEYLETGKAPNLQKDFQAFYTPKVIVDLMIGRAGVKPGQLILEPSCGDGRIAFAVRGMGCTVHCCEINELERIPLENEFRFLGTDFLKVDPNPVYDRVLMNPPFTKGQDVIHISHAFKFLRPGGRLVSIASPSWTFRTDKRSVEFGAFVGLHGDWEELPEKSFSESGTNVRTVMVTLDK